MPATIARFLSFASLLEAMMDRTPTGSTATGFSMKTCLPASMAALRCIGLKAGWVVSITRSMSVARSFLYASNPVNIISGVTFTFSFRLAAGSCMSCVWMMFRQFFSLSSKRSAIAISSTFSDELRQSRTAPEPLLPQPIRPTFILSLPTAKSLPVFASIVAIETDADDLRKIRRDMLLFIKNPFMILKLIQTFY